MTDRANCSTSTTNWRQPKPLATDVLEKPARLLPKMKLEELVTVMLLTVAAIDQYLPIGLVLAGVLLVYITVVHGDFIYRSYLTLNRDLTGLALIIDVKIDLWLRLHKNKGIHELFLDIVRKYPNKPAMIDIEKETTETFEEFNAHCNRYANYFQGLGYRSGDVVALYMENSVEFVAAWMGLAKIGVVTAWINSNLKREQLVHCITASKTKAIITSVTLQNMLIDAIDQKLFKVDGIDVYSVGEPKKNSGFKNLQKKLDAQAISEPKTLDTVDFKSVLCFIYTSGTTGMPKAAVMKHFRYYSIAVGAAKSFGIRSSDRMYVSMPIYHTAAGILGVGQALLGGSSCVIRKKFSASNFWRDCVKYDCTVSQYIGEICRYLLAQPVVKEESVHRMRLLVGNGLRAEIWQPFVDRFRVRIGELYGSTEGTSSLVNIDGHVGACGFLPISPLTKKMHPVRLIKVDDVTGEAIRTADGLCIACNPGESGAMVSTIRKNNPLLQFEGYLNKKETNKKIIRDVFAKGDSCFLTGDLLHWDRLGYVYFKDRTGDTFRWKGENVSTTEVEAILHPITGLSDATVYGVEVPKREGRVGMASVVRAVSKEENESEFVQRVGARLSSSLTSYAIPQFIRICQDVEKTGTFKLVKTNLQRIGITDIPSDSIYIFNSENRIFVPFDNDLRCKVSLGSYPF
ncbi:hypothetical protein GCK72_014299 [Caenorhabditis remanei]|uniref:long-chain-fatty-acid--CoA ligase n=2 Tax=Caenorhabditis remanei TaxID=31234 RepID=E3MT30_CAERE|nr:hypothetical protein GCK72_014299 [Caenorhabditis remanei]EFP08561.1 hypothetical protein CRE_15585 [Caenorhabditis remanei]KAF1757842.1 hypothetical protein GCK72_014299 [Caenorhabditis remanei]